MRMRNAPNQGAFTIVHLIVEGVVECTRKRDITMDLCIKTISQTARVYRAYNANGQHIIDFIE